VGREGVPEICSMAGRRHGRRGLLHGDASMERPVIRRGRKRVRRQQDGFVSSSFIPSPL
jgi:hypothetical protein